MSKIFLNVMKENKPQIQEPLKNKSRIKIKKNTTKYIIGQLLKSSDKES